MEYLFSEVVSTFAILSFGDEKFWFQLHALLLCLPAKLADHFAGQIVEDRSKSVPTFGRPCSVVYLVLFRELFSLLGKGLAEIALVAYEINALLGNVLGECLVNVVVAFL
jgi:hypothetical protein